MRILVVDFAAKNGGALTVIENFYKETLIDSENEYIFLLSRNIIDERPKENIIIFKNNWITRLYFDFIGAKRIIKKYKIDKLISFQNTIPNVKSIKRILFMHQALPFQNVKKFSFFKKREITLAFRQNIIGLFIKKSILKSDKVIVQTEWIKKAIVDKCNISEEKIIIVKPEINCKLKINNQINYNRFFYPTSNYIYKNNELILKCVEKLVKEGFYNFKVELTINGENNKNINYIGTISKEEVYKKYTNSVLIFPSYIETFGLPLLEAKLCGTIILAADTPFAHEILDDYKNAYFFDPFKEMALYDLMLNCISGKINIKQVNQEEYIKNLKKAKKLIDII